MDDKSGRLKKKRGVTRTSVTKICKAIETELTKTDVNVDALEEMLEQLAVESNELKNLDSQIEEFVSDDKLEKEVAEYTQKIITWKFRATKKIRERTKNVDSLNVPSSCYKESSSNIKLPKLSISKFYGQSSLWLSFWNSFEPAIHENDSLSEVSKFNYLKAHLGGSALSTIEGFALTPENYEIAIKLLKERFGRSDVLINTHLNNLLRICPLKNSDDIVSFRKIKIAERRLNSCIKALERAEKLVDYDDVYQDWQKEGIIEEVDPMQEIKQGQHFLPHHPVFKENSTTKVRPVFDGSAKERNTPSINDCLEKGPNLVELIPSLMNRFRVGKYGVTADIKKAFLQIGLQERDRPYLRFLWKDRGREGNIKILQHKRVVFGIFSSPFLLGATLELHLKNAPDHLKETAQQLMRSFYVDNCVFSVNTKKELARFISESQALLSTAKFELRGWEHSPTEDKIEERQEDLKVPVLGLLWNLPKDTMSLDMKGLMKEDKGPTTKRKILSTVHRIFDPIGFSCPVTLEPKCLLQECWKLGLSWDAELPLLITERFERWKMKLPKLNALQIPSQSAYATCIFLRAESADNASCQLIQARNRVAPLKKISIPRLELLSCTIGARLAKATISELGLEKIPIFYWYDSMNALYWIKRNENWATFVYNRVLEIRKLTNPEDWRHIIGTLNPADLPSRGSNAEELVKYLWWEGPNWLRRPIEDWPVSETIPDFDVVNSEKRKTIVSVTNTTTEQLEYFSKVSSFRKMTRITAWIFRFYKNAKTQKKERKGGTLDLEEVEAAEKFILKQVQSQCFSGNEKLNLQTFLDSDGLLKVKTKISQRSDIPTFRFPILLPSKHAVIGKLIFEKHVELSHAGIQILMSSLRENYWILKSRKTIRQVIRTCVICQRFASRP
ncbi:hypothetical protein AVEN_257492-1 [Araneus ventricosus]|uniref:Uncharacterized protein n=1 Tax=Araneus ventricosus TaxID=182803 RepID=A0A4Y2X3A5_ARAVE|nr:hypothetical protein AVEN_257492-1 [Araneus ventricosus]